ncbi:hypothetical protein Bbelb_201120 [Branchiostoma belcheri]|nr:hypothetical protein Bbelb_201120 [Branchiostoma belcheri]
MQTGTGEKSENKFSAALSQGMYNGIKKALGPSVKKTAPLEHMTRWVEHYSDFYSQETSVSDMAFTSIKELPIMRSLTKCLPWISLANVLLYGSETWITYKRQERLLNSFHMRCLMRILGLSWQDRTPYSVILQRARVPIMYPLLSKRCLHCLGHFRRMEDDNWETLAMDRSAWKLSLQKGIMEADSKRGSDTAAKRAKRRQATPATSYICTTCGRACNSHVGHYSHRRRYPPRRQTK